MADGLWYTETSCHNRTIYTGFRAIRSLSRFGYAHAKVKQVTLIDSIIGNLHAVDKSLKNVVFAANDTSESFLLLNYMLKSCDGILTIAFKWNVSRKTRLERNTMVPVCSVTLNHVPPNRRSVVSTFLV